MADGSASNMSLRWSLKGMTALVTGATKGIGHAIVEELAGLGATIHICARNKDDIDNCLKDWEAKGYQVTGSVCDVSVPAAREELMKTVSTVFGGKLNILVNSAALYIFKNTLDFTAEDHSKVMATTLDSAYHFSTLAHPLLKASGSGNIVFISSVAGVVALPMLSNYSACKGAINQITKSFACEWAKDYSCQLCCTMGYQNSTSRTEATRQGVCRQHHRKNPNPSHRRTEGCFISGCFPMPPSCFLHHWPSYLCGWRIINQWFPSTT